jgi:hypothetical protein
MMKTNVWPMISAFVAAANSSRVSSAECRPNPLSAAKVHATLYGIRKN